MASEVSYSDQSIYDSNSMKKKKAREVIVYSNLEPMPSENIVIQILGAEPRKLDRKAILEYLLDNKPDKPGIAPVESQKSYRTGSDAIHEQKKRNKQSLLSDGLTSSKEEDDDSLLIKKTVSKVAAEADLTKQSKGEKDDKDAPKKYYEKPTKGHSKKTRRKREESPDSDTTSSEETSSKTFLHRRKKRKTPTPNNKLPPPDLTDTSSYKLLPIPVRFRHHSGEIGKNFISFDKLDISDYGVVHRKPILNVVRGKIKTLVQKFQKRFMKKTPDEDEEEEEPEDDELFLEQEKVEKDDLSREESIDKKRRHVVFEDEVVDPTVAKPGPAIDRDETVGILPEKSKSIIKTDISASSSDFSALPPLHDHELNSTLYSFAYNIPKHIFNDEKFKWLFLDDQKKEIQRETQDIGGFRAYDSGDTSSSHTKDNISDSEWIQELYTSDELSEFDDKYYYFLEYKDYEAKTRARDLKSEKLKAEILAQKNIKHDKHYGKNMTKIIRYWKKYQAKKQNFQKYFKEPVEYNAASMTKDLNDSNLKPALGNLNMKEKIIQWERRHYQQQIHPRRYQGVLPEDISTHLLAVFREDMLSMSGDRCFKVWRVPEPGEQITLSSPQQFLKSLRFDSEIADELDIKTDDLFERVQISLKWARTMTSSLARPRAELVMFLAVCTVPETMRWFTRLVEAVVNRRINSKTMILGYLNVLYDIEIEYIPIDLIYPYPQHPKVTFDDYLLLKKMKRRIFSSFYRTAKQKYAEEGINEVPPKALKFLYNMAMLYYKSGLYKHKDYLIDILHKGIPKTPIEWAGAAMKLMAQEEVTSIYQEEKKDYITLDSKKAVPKYMIKKYYDQIENHNDEIF